ncbi:type III-B CRISPR module RAMP protein Cmr6 [Actinomadura sp. 7K507]|uniref:type III-B CRISPR module RAMP protein Cmr6 n=1 Tax=Actinomadura sp. 7K507 TaxID=2530365 RepID=UPI0014042A79|nr:type III-B CRISPR module RAMP protein Cmr6 [Actinomadura sp. 7K507]
MPEPLLTGPVGLRHPGRTGISELWRSGQALATANARLILLRTAYLTIASGEFELDDGPVHRWAIATNLGQGARVGTHLPPGGMPGESARLMAAVTRRRAAAVAALEDGETSVRTLGLAAESAVVTGTGAGGVRDVGIELHGTYGWPILPGSTLKGVTREWARQLGFPAARISEIFGSAPKADEQIPGGVAFFDALPWRYGVEVTSQVLTPHTRGYRSAAGDGPEPPGEHINPVPIPFLGVERGWFVTHLAGPRELVDEAADLLADAVGELGVGAKTASGYGYFTARPVNSEEEL